MLAALTDQKSGNSTPRCSKLTEPSRQFVMTTSRRSQVTSSYGCTPSVVYTRLTRRPGAPLPPRRLPPPEFAPGLDSAAPPAAGVPTVSVIVLSLSSLALVGSAPSGLPVRCGPADLTG